MVVEKSAGEQLQQELDRSMQRLSKGMEFATDLSEPEVGKTPRELVGRRGKSKLYLYRAATPERRGLPILFVPNLGISRPYIFDLQPKASFIEYVTNQGFDFYLLDWGIFGMEDRGFSVEDASMDVIASLARKQLRHSGAEAINLVGYCMGVPLSLGYAATHPETPIRTLVMMAGPMDFRQAGAFGTWTQPGAFDVDKLIDAYGNVPLDFVKVGFKLLQPMNDTVATTNLWWNMWNDAYVEGYRAMNKWSNEWVPFPGEFFKQWIKWFYQENRLYDGKLTLRGKPVDLKTLEQPILVVGAKQDRIAPPGAVRGLMDVIGSKEKEYVELPGGHISLVAGRQAHQNLWPKLIAWLGEHNAEPAKAKRGR